MNSPQSEISRAGACSRLEPRADDALDDSWFDWKGRPARPPQDRQARPKGEPAPLRIGDDLADTWFR
jgi:hypothetical protein